MPNRPHSAADLPRDGATRRRRETIGAALILIEAAVETLDSALAAARGGADRIELCANLSVGGTTPSAGLIAAVVDQVQLPVVVMIRPRGGDFAYSREETDTMTRDIELGGKAGIAGIVTGALTPSGRIDVERLRVLARVAAGLPLTFHRAFDSAPNLPDALEQLIEIGVMRVLTSGGAPTALEGAATIASLVGQARGRISVIAGGGIRDHNVREVIARTSVREVHSRLVDEMSMRSLVEVARTTADFSS
jgi:copper homeostasis protein